MSRMVEKLCLLESGSFTPALAGAFVLVTGFSEDCNEQRLDNLFLGELVKLNRCSRWGHPLYAILKYESIGVAQREIDRLDGALMNGRRISVSWLFDQQKTSSKVVNREEFDKESSGFYLLYRSQYDQSAMEIEVREDGRIRVAANWWCRAGFKAKERKVFEEGFLSREGVELLRRLIIDWEGQFKGLSDCKSELPERGPGSCGREELEFVVHKKRTVLSSNMTCSDSVYAEVNLMPRLASFLYTVKKLRGIFWCMIDA